MCACVSVPVCTFRAVDSVAERLLQWLPYLLEHLDAFINRFHTQTVSLGKTTVLLELGYSDNLSGFEFKICHVHRTTCVHGLCRGPEPE